MNVLLQAYRNWWVNSHQKPKHHWNNIKISSPICPTALHFFKFRKRRKTDAIFLFQADN